MNTKKSLKTTPSQQSVRQEQRQKNNLSASLADDFFSDQFASFVNQSPSSFSSPGQQEHYFNFHGRTNSNESSSRYAEMNSVSQQQQQQQQQQRQYNKITTSSTVLLSPVKKSAFSFISTPSNSVNLLKINQGKEINEINDNDSDDDNSITPRPQSPKQSMLIINNNKKKQEQQSKEINQLSAETTWKRIQAEKEREKDKIQRCYNKRVLIHEQMIQLQKEIKNIEIKTKEAMDSEDYLQAQTLEQQQTKLTEKLWDVFGHTEEQVEQQIHTCWKTLADLLAKETEAAKKLANACKHTKDERERQLLKYHIDNERKYEEKLQQINQQRGKLDEEKSEIAFDMEMWEQSNTEFKNKMDELVHKEKSKKNEVTLKMKNVQMEIDELMERLGELQQKRDEYEAEIHQLDITMHETTNQYVPEKEALENDHILVQQRKHTIEKKSIQLDREDEHLYREMEQLTKDEERGKNELDSLQEQITMATKQLEQGQEEHDAILNIFHEYIQSRDDLVINKKQAMIQAHNSVTHQIKSSETKRHQLYTAQCRLEDQESTIQNLKSQLNSLNRQKKLAVETRQLQLAAEARSQIQSIESTLIDSEAIRDDRQKSVDKSLVLLRDEEYQMEKLKKECINIQQTSSKEYNPFIIFD
ncbi:hypothetical protein INT45_004733 [Circinella minor]|uniref:Uncharacterized protein n=1 Tax=Circinella minor TaxID=1195481 RepID=A0A8H7VM29_9FUNG|nr:hypothetical protein INT45_004733 [Circinella minor]